MQLLYCLQSWRLLLLPPVATSANLALDRANLAPNRNTSTIPTGTNLLHGAGWGLEPEQFLGELFDLRVRHLPEAPPRRLRVSTPRSGAHAVIGRTAGRSFRTHRTRTRTDARCGACIGPGSQALGLLCGAVLAGARAAVETPLAPKLTSSSAGRPITPLGGVKVPSLPFREP